MEEVGDQSAAPEFTASFKLYWRIVFHVKSPFELPFVELEGVPKSRREASGTPGAVVEANLSAVAGPQDQRMNRFDGEDPPQLRFERNPGVHSLTASRASGTTSGGTGLDVSASHSSNS